MLYYGSSFKRVVALFVYFFVFNIFYSAVTVRLKEHGMHIVNTTLGFSQSLVVDTLYIYVSYYI